MFNHQHSHLLMKSYSLLLVPLLSLVWASSAFAQTSNVPTLMNYQAYVTDASGVPIGQTAGEPAPVDRLVHFRFWDHATNADKTAGGNLLFSHSQTVTINNGDFSVLLGQGGAITGDVSTYTDFADVFNSKDVFLGITVDVDGGDISNDGEIAPRQQLVSAAFAFRSKVAESVDNLAINSAMLAVDAVNSDNLRAGAVTESKVVDSAITSAKIQDLAVQTGDIADSAITTAKLLNDAVTSDKIKDLNVTTGDIANFAVTNGKLASNSVMSGNITDGQVSQADLVAAVQQALCPPGTIVAFGGNTAPAGWLLCNGNQYSTSGTYAALYQAIGNNFGISGSNFRVPDFRGRFLRGKDGGVGRDPDRTSRTAMNSGGASGDNVGSVQGDQFKQHDHTYNKSYTTAEPGGGRAVADWYGSTTPNTSSTGGNETRPINAYVNYIIKY